MQTAAKSLTAESSWEESVSAWMDGEGSEDFFPEMSHPHGRQTWDTYHLIGDALRNADLAVSPSAQFQARLARALEAELPIVAAPRRRSPLRLGLSGLAVAAAVAT
ncbi:sigma-E factor negative regulatory protein, partial [Bordetella pertussis]